LVLLAMKNLLYTDLRFLVWVFIVRSARSVIAPKFSWSPFDDHPAIEGSA